MIRIFGKRKAIFGICLTMGVGLILGTGAPALAAEATLDSGSGAVKAAIAVPNFVTYRNKSRVASATGTGETFDIRARTGQRSTAGSGTGQRSTAGAASGERSTAGAGSGADVACSEDAGADPLLPAQADAGAIDAECP
jgi:hypothetical protein